ncbi:DMT family transporter [Chthonobacter albigriseus]|uniref:DMT family transporter n=1 Tax=Chthonobacter albigriseus TaxID=1683161 RepID=UPI0015EE7412|nr:DMT family transporter [Chthonobacter albigriseus]
MKTRLDGLALLVLVLCCASWGFNQVAVKAALEGIPPVLQMGLRSAVAGLLVWGWCLLRGVPLMERDGSLLPGLLLGTFFGLEFLVLFIGLGYTTASHGAILLYLAPFMVAGLAHVMLGERLTVLKVTGLAVAFAGVVLLFSGSGEAAAGPHQLYGDVLCVLASVGWAFSTILIKKTVLLKIPAEKTLLYQLAVSAAMGLVVSVALGEPAADFSTAPVVWSFAYQTLWVGSVTYMIWFSLMRIYPASLLTAASFMTPIFGVIGGIVFLAEPLTWNLAAAVALVALGIVLVNRPQAAQAAAA